jgi:Metallo-beta-lactamase superfamily
MLGGAASAAPEALTIRWYSTSNYELNFRDRGVLLDTFYDRGPRMRGLGFRPDEVVRAGVVLIGHPHYDHMSDAAQVALQTRAPVVIHPPGADVLIRGGLDTSKIIAVTGFDYSFEVVGRSQTIRLAWNATRQGGTTVVVGARQPQRQRDVQRRRAIRRRAQAAELRLRFGGCPDRLRPVAATLAVRAAGPDRPRLPPRHPRRGQRRLRGNGGVTSSAASSGSEPREQWTDE